MSLGDAKELLGDATMSLGDAKSSLGDVLTGSSWWWRTALRTCRTRCAATASARSGEQGIQQLEWHQPHAGLLGRLCVVPAGALPVPVSDSL
jgi:hypothetical protein